MIDNRFVSPRRGGVGRCQSALANARWLRSLRRALIGRLPFARLESDVRDVVYLTWLLPVAAVARLVPPGVALVSWEGMTPFTILTYAHGHFGPAAAGRLRCLFPSPLQSNWRLYVATIDGQAPPDATVLFVRNLFDRAMRSAAACSAMRCRRICRTVSSIAATVATGGRISTAAWAAPPASPA